MPPPSRPDYPLYRSPRERVPPLQVPQYRALERLALVRMLPEGVNL